MTTTVKTDQIQPGLSRLHVDEVAHSYELVLADAFGWLARREPDSVHGVVTDPPYGVVEYQEEQLAKKRAGSGGVWRVPPALDGHVRKPVPRFTTLTQDQLDHLSMFFGEFGRQLVRVLVPGAHVFIATNPLVSQRLYAALCDSGLEKRGELVRLVSTLRGGDRPKNAHDEFAGVTVMPRSSWEPWGIFRKPLEGRVQDNLRKWGTGGLRRVSHSEPFRDVVKAGFATRQEREIAPHPTLKPQKLLRRLTRAVLPLGYGTIVDPFMGSGSTVAAAASQGLHAIGVESNPEFFQLAVRAVPELAGLSVD